MLGSEALKREKDGRCREVLSTLLSEQLEKNEELEQENFVLEEEQRKLLSLLQAKMEELRRMQEETIKYARNNDSTLEVTQLTPRGTLEEVEKEKLNLMGKIDFL
jgi:hypothetical protein